LTNILLGTSWIS